MQGGDEENEMSYPNVIKRLMPENAVMTMDIRKDSKAMLKGYDYLKTDIEEIMQKFKAQMIFTNPPFNLAMDFIKKSLEDVEENGYVIMLLRLNFLGSRERNEWLKNNMPFEIYVHAKRMSFTGDGKTDSIEYAHFVWKKGWKGSARVFLLDY